ALSLRRNRCFRYASGNRARSRRGSISAQGSEAMRLRHIEVFHAIMQVGTISGAAQVLHISQPAVTKVLQHAELQLGMPLFERVRGKLYPKPEAHRLFAETEKLNR